MTITETEAYTKMLLKRHLLKDYKNWKVEFYYTTKYGGCCNVDRKLIMLSLYAIQHLTTSQMQEICQHEVAHAIAYTNFKCNSHNYIWQNVCAYVVKCPANETINYSK